MEILGTFDTKTRRSRLLDFEGERDRYAIDALDAIAVSKVSVV
jgi:hypothetical protein